MMMEPLWISTVFDGWPSLLISSLMKGTLILVIVAGLAWLWKGRSASDRHWLWVLALASLVLLPIADFAGLQWNILPRGSEYAPSEQPETAPPSQAFEIGLPAVTPVVLGERAIAPSFQFSQPAPKKPFSWWEIVWLAGLSLAVMRFLAGHFMLWSLASQPEEGSIQRRVDEMSQQLGIGKHVPIYTTGRRAMPMTWGIFRVKILLPDEASTWEKDRLEAVLWHELAHVKRRDGLVQVLVQFVTALYWFHPLVWFSAWRLFIERERACDDVVIARGVRPSAYARHLMEIAVSAEPYRLCAAAAMSMARPSQLAGRIKQLLDTGSRRRPMSGRGLSILALCWAALVFPLAALHSEQETGPEVDGSVSEPLSDTDIVEPAEEEADQHAFSHEELEAIQKRIAEAKLDLAQLSLRYGEKHPKMLLQRAHIEALNDRLESVSRRLAETEASRQALPAVVEEHEGRYGDALRFLKREVESLNEEIDKEKDVLAQLSVKYKDKHPKMIESRQNIEALNQKLEILSRRLSETESLAQAVPVVAEDDLRERYRAERETLDQLKSKYLPKHPRMMQQTKVVNDLARRLAKMEATVRVATPQPGIVTEVKVRPGDTVKKGGTLLVLDQRRAALALETASSRLELAERRLATARERYEMIKTLVSQGTLSPADQQSELAAIQQAQSELTVAQAALETARLDLDDLTVRAPADGEIVSVAAHAGEYVSPEEPVVHLKKTGD